MTSRAASSNFTRVAALRGVFIACPIPTSWYISIVQRGGGQPVFTERMVFRGRMLSGPHASPTRRNERSHHVVGPQATQRRVRITLDLYGRVADAKSAPQFGREIVRPPVLGLAAVDQMHRQR